MRLTSCLLFLFLVVTLAVGQDSKFPTGPQYLMNYGSPILLRSIATPSLSLQSPALETGASNATASLSAGAENNTQDTMLEAQPGANLVPLGDGRVPTSVIEVTSGGVQTDEQLKNLPPTILDLGTWQVTTAQDLHERGFGVSLVEASAYWKSHVRHASHSYGNADIERLQPKN